MSENKEGRGPETPAPATSLAALPCSPYRWKVSLAMLSNGTNTPRAPRAGRTPASTVYTLDRAARAQTLTPVPALPEGTTPRGSDPHYVGNLSLRVRPGYTNGASDILVYHRTSGTVLLVRLGFPHKPTTAHNLPEQDVTVVAPPSAEIWREPAHAPDFGRAPYGSLHVRIGGAHGERLVFLLGWLTPHEHMAPAYAYGRQEVTVVGPHSYLVLRRRIVEHQNRACAESERLPIPTL